MALPDTTGECQHAIAVQGLRLATLVHERWREGHVAETSRRVEVREAPTSGAEGSRRAQSVRHDLLVDGMVNGNAGRFWPAPAVLTLYGAGRIALRSLEIDGATIGPDKPNQRKYG